MLFHEQAPTADTGQFNKLKIIKVQIPHTQTENYGSTVNQFHNNSY